MTKVCYHSCPYIPFLYYIFYCAQTSSALLSYWLFVTNAVYFVSLLGITRTRRKHGKQPSCTLFLILAPNLATQPDSISSRTMRIYSDQYAVSSPFHLHVRSPLSSLQHPVLLTWSTHLLIVKVDQHLRLTWFYFFQLQLKRTPLNFVNLESAKFHAPCWTWAAPHATDMQHFQRLLKSSPFCQKTSVQTQQMTSESQESLRLKMSVL